MQVGFPGLMSCVDFDMEQSSRFVGLCGIFSSLCFVVFGTVLCQNMFVCFLQCFCWVFRRSYHSKWISNNSINPISRGQKHWVRVSHVPRCCRPKVDSFLTTVVDNCFYTIIFFRFQLQHDQNQLQLGRDAP